MNHLLCILVSVNPTPNNLVIKLLLKIVQFKVFFFSQVMVLKYLFFIKCGGGGWGGWATCNDISDYFGYRY